MNEIIVTDRSTLEQIIRNVCIEVFNGVDNKTVTNEWLSLQQAAEAYRRDRSTIVRWCNAGILRGFKTGSIWQVESPAMRNKRITLNY